MIQKEEGGTLLMCQSDRNPDEFTHFDCWENDPYSLDADLADVAYEFSEVLRVWSETLKCPPIGGGRHFNSFYDMLFTLGFDMVLDLVTLDLLQYGFDVYRGSGDGGFVEIYANSVTR